MTTKLKGTFPPPLTFAALVALGLALNWIWPLHLSARFPQARLAAGATLAHASGAMALLAFRLMKMQGTPVDFNRETTAIVTGGPFRFTRNPLYLSLLLLYAALALLLNSLWLLLLAPAMLALFNRLAIREEAYLAETFGEEYLAYMKRVRRWL